MKKKSCYKLFDVFASKARMQIITALLTKEKSVQEICSSTGLEQSNVSHQLRLMQRCHVVSAKRCGKQKIYSIEKSAIRIIKAANAHIKEHCKGEC